MIAIEYNSSGMKSTKLSLPNTKEGAFCQVARQSKKPSQSTSLDIKFIAFIATVTDFIIKSSLVVSRINGYSRNADSDACRRLQRQSTSPLIRKMASPFFPKRKSEGL